MSQAVTKFPGIFGDCECECGQGAADRREPSGPRDHPGAAGSRCL